MDNQELRKALESLNEQLARLQEKLREGSDNQQPMERQIETTRELVRLEREAMLHQAMAIAARAGKKSSEGSRETS
jgi:hypothetical protein